MGTRPGSAALPPWFVTSFVAEAPDLASAHDEPHVTALVRAGGCDVAAVCSPLWDSDIVAARVEVIAGRRYLALLRQSTAEAHGIFLRAGRDAPASRRA